MFRRTASVCALYPDAEISPAIRLKGDPLTVRRPDRKPIASAERELPHLARARQIVDPDERLLLVISHKRDLLAIGRDARVLVCGRREFQRLDIPLAVVDERQIR